MRTSDDYLGYAIGPTPQTLAYLTNMHIPIPDQVVYTPASTYVQRADGTRVGHGYPSAQWIWDVISNSALSQLLEFLNGADYAYVYMRTDTREGIIKQPRNAYDVFYAIMYKPILAGQEGTPIARSPYAMQSVQIQFHRLIPQPGYL